VDLFCVVYYYSSCHLTESELSMNSHCLCLQEYLHQLGIADCRFFLPYIIKARKRICSQLALFGFITNNFRSHLLLSFMGSSWSNFSTTRNTCILVRLAGGVLRTPFSEMGFYPVCVWYCGCDLKNYFIKIFLVEVDLIFIYVWLKLWLKLRLNKK
jgi:hypothetical protein